MTPKPAIPTEALLEELTLTREAVDAAAREYKFWMAHSRKLALEAITDHGLSLARVSSITGHHRNTLKVWLDLWNAENKSATPSQE